MGKKRKSEDMEDECEAETAKEEVGETLPWEVKITRVNEIANPLATQKLCKKLFKLIHKSKKQKVIINGVKSVKKALVKKQKGIVVLAGDVYPIDVYSHFPVLCEDMNVPYCYVPTRQDLGQAMLAFNSVVCMVQPHDSYTELYDACREKIESLPQPIQA